MCVDELDVCAVIIIIGSAITGHPEGAKTSIIYLLGAVLCIIFVMMIYVDAATPERILSGQGRPVYGCSWILAC